MSDVMPQARWVEGVSKEQVQALLKPGVLVEVIRDESGFLPTGVRGYVRDVGAELFSITLSPAAKACVGVEEGYLLVDPQHDRVRIFTPEVLGHIFPRSFGEMDEISTDIRRKDVNEEVPVRGASGSAVLTRFADCHIAGRILSDLYAKGEIHWHPEDVVVDTRVHHLKEGWYPSIPGWHLDHITRKQGEGQPTALFDQSQNPAQHIGVILDWGTGSLTEFTDEPITLDQAKVDPDHVWKSVDRQITDLAPKTRKVTSGTPFRFGYGDFHRTTPATGTGMRFFMRISFNSGRKVENIIERQSNVYIPTDKLTGGW